MKSIAFANDAQEYIAQSFFILVKYLFQKNGKLLCVFEGSSCD
jgi:hypothetical protein